MMYRTVWKYVMVQTQELLPVGTDAKILHVGMTTGRLPTLWVEHRVSSNVAIADRPTHYMHVEVCGTGDNIADDLKHVGTVQVSQTLVWHVYEKTGEMTRIARRGRVRP